MQVNGDFSGLQPTGAPQSAATPKRSADPQLRNSQKSDEDARRHQDNEAAKDGRPVFNPVQTESAPAGFQPGSDAPSEAGHDDGKPEFVRPEKRPTREPVSLSSDDSNGLYASLAAAGRPLAVRHRQPIPVRFMRVLPGNTPNNRCPQPTYLRAVATFWKLKPKTSTARCLLRHPVQHL